MQEYVAWGERRRLGVVRIRDADEGDGVVGAPTGVDWLICYCWRFELTRCVVQPGGESLGKACLLRLPNEWPAYRLDWHGG